MANKRTSTRRSFLKGRSAADALLDIAHGDDASTATSREHNVSAATLTDSAQPYLVHYSRRAMACQFEVLVNAGQYAQAGEAALAALDLVDQLEAQLTVYRDTSEISRLNAAAAERRLPVEPRLFDLLQTAVTLYESTDGAFDITSGPLSRAWGFARRQGAIPTDDARESALSCVGSDKLLLDATACTLAFTAPGVELNLGGIGKGHALDRAAERMFEDGVYDFLWHGGKSSVLAAGSHASRRAAGEGWIVGLTDPLRPERRVAEIRLHDRALSTSGTSVQFFRHGGKRFGHILDPRTGWPADGVFSATALAPTAAEADALSTAFYVMGVKRTLAYCESRPQIAALLLYPGREGGSVQVEAANLSDADWRMVSAG